jgi:hypothetical protein
VIGIFVLSDLLFTFIRLGEEKVPSPPSPQLSLENVNGSASDE